MPTTTKQPHVMLSVDDIKDAPKPRFHCGRCGGEEAFTPAAVGAHRCVNPVTHQPLDMDAVEQSSAGKPTSAARCSPLTSCLARTAVPPTSSRGLCIAVPARSSRSPTTQRWPNGSVVGPWPRWRTTSPSSATSSSGRTTHDVAPKAPPEGQGPSPRRVAGLAAHRSHGDAGGVRPVPQAEETRPLLEAVDHLDVAIDTLAELVPVATLKAEAVARRPAIYVLDSFSEV